MQIMFNTIQDYKYMTQSPTNLHTILGTGPPLYTLITFYICSSGSVRTTQINLGLHIKQHINRPIFIVRDIYIYILELCE